MTTPLLSTKLYVPHLRTEFVSRPRLLARLDATLKHKLTLISAPAGFGKTMLLGDWIRSAALRVAWVSLDQGDNDPARFLSYVIAALQTVCEGLGAAALGALRSRELPDPEAVLTGLINEIVAGIAEPLVLVLDDYHVIQARLVHEAVEYLLGHLPPQMHWIIATRADPPLPLSRLRGLGQLNELRASDLRFTPDEASAFLNQGMGLSLSAAEVAALGERTEGWIVGLQLAALSMQGHKDIPGFIRAFTGTNRYILDYLVEEVVNRQSPAIQSFLLKTAILERLTAPLCDALNLAPETQADAPSPPASRQGELAAQEMLEELDAANLFVIPLDDERRWYRYHHLFADLLRNRLHQTHPEWVQPLHHRASVWHEENGLLADAIAHALAANDLERMASLVERNAFAIMERGELSSLVQWLDAMPRETTLSRPWLSISHAWALAYMGNLDAAEPLLEDAEKAIRSLAGAEAEQQKRIAGHIAAIRAYSVYIKGNLHRATKLAGEALSRIPHSDQRARGFATALFGAILKWTGDLAAAGRTSATAVAISQKARDPHVTVHAICDLAALHILRGQLHQAASTCREALQIAGTYVEHGARPLPVTGHAHALLSAVLLEWNDLQAALRHAHEGIELCKLSGQADVLTTGYRSLSGVLRASGDLDGALSAIREARRAAERVSLWYGRRAAAWEARLRLSIGDVDSARAWALESGRHAHDEPEFQYAFEYCTLARVLMVDGMLEDALDLLGELRVMAQTTEAMGYAIEILVVQAMALRAQGKAEQALAALERALSLAAPEGYVRTFSDEGEPMSQLLRQAATQGMAQDYVNSLLAVLDASRETQLQRTKEPPPSPLIEPLTPRELEVLRLLITHLSSTEIGERLFVSPNTVRSHIKSIYGKMGVHSRQEAVDLAQELGLL